MKFIVYVFDDPLRIELRSPEPESGIITVILRINFFDALLGIEPRSSDPKSDIIAFIL
jgi:hypothetical protein